MSAPYSFYKTSGDDKSFFRGVLLSEKHFKKPDELKNYHGELRLLNMERLIVQISEGEEANRQPDGDREDNRNGNNSLSRKPNGRYQVSVFGEPLKFLPLTQNGAVVMTSEAVREACYMQRVH